QAPTTPGYSRCDGASPAVGRLSAAHLRRGDGRDVHQSDRPVDEYGIRARGARVCHLVLGRGRFDLACAGGLAWTPGGLGHIGRRALRLDHDPDVRHQSWCGASLVIVVVGLSHQAAPIEVREELAFSTERAAEFAKDLVMRVPVREAMVLSTCNRVEVIAAAESADEQLLAEVASVCAHQLESRATQASRYLYRHSGQAAVRHLFRVAASLDSMVVGEPQILGQL